MRARDRRPAAAASGDPAFRIAAHPGIQPEAISHGIKTCLYEGRAVAFSIPVFDSWYCSSATSRWGKITLPLAGEAENGGHAMTLVGYQDDADAPGGGYFLVRNSWQPWSWDGVWQEGYGYIPYAYISRHATAVFSAYRHRRRGASPAGSARRDANRAPAAVLTWNSPDSGCAARPMAESSRRRRCPASATRSVRARHQPRPGLRLRCAGEVFCAPAAPYSAARRPGSASAGCGALAQAGRNRLGPLAWTPPDAGPYALLARLSSADDRRGATLDPAVR